jgi:hypothetical protein
VAEVTVKSGSNADSLDEDGMLSVLEGKITG